MDDFLHNLRSGKLKQTDRNRRDFSDYKGPQRRVTNDRRKTDYYAKVTNENFALIKETLDVLADCQKRIADAMVERKKTEARAADALEAIARMMDQQMGMGNAVSRSDIIPAVEPMESTNENHPMAESLGNQPQDEATQPSNPPDLINVISTMRDKGDSWEKIARHFDEQKIPTVSGKGKWRGPAIKKYWMTNA